MNTTWSMIIAVTSVSLYACDNSKWKSKSDSWAIPDKKTRGAFQSSQPIDIPHIKSHPVDPLIDDSKKQESIYWILTKLRKYQRNNEPYITEEDYKFYFQQEVAMAVIFTNEDLCSIEKMQEEKALFNNIFAERLACKLKFHSLLIQLVDRMNLEEKGKERIIYQSNNLYKSNTDKLFERFPVDLAIDSLQHGARFALAVIVKIESELEKK